MLGLRSARGISQIVEMNRVAVQAGLADLQRLALFVVVDLVQGRAGQGSIHVQPGNVINLTLNKTCLSAGKTGNPLNLVVRNVSTTVCTFSTALNPTTGLAITCSASTGSMWVTQAHTGHVRSIHPRPMLYLMILKNAVPTAVQAHFCKLLVSFYACQRSE